MKSEELEKELPKIKELYEEITRKHLIGTNTGRGYCALKLLVNSYETQLSKSEIRDLKKNILSRFEVSAITLEKNPVPWVS